MDIELRVSPIQAVIYPWHDKKKKSLQNSSQHYESRILRTVTQCILNFHENDGKDAKILEN